MKKRRIISLILCMFLICGMCACGKEKAVLKPLTPDENIFVQTLFGMSEEEFTAKMGELQFSERTADDGTIIKTYFTATEENANFTSFRAYGFIDNKLCMQRYSANLKVLEGDYTKGEVHGNFETTMENFVNFIEENYATGELEGTYSDLNPGVVGSWPVGESDDIQIIAMISDDVQDNFGRISLYYYCNELIP